MKWRRDTDSSEEGDEEALSGAEFVGELLLAEADVGEKEEEKGGLFLPGKTAKRQILSWSVPRRRWVKYSRIPWSCLLEHSA